MTTCVQPSSLITRTYDSMMQACSPIGARRKAACRGGSVDQSESHFASSRMPLRRVSRAAGSKNGQGMNPVAQAFVYPALG